MRSIRRTSLSPEKDLMRTCGSWDFHVCLVFRDSCNINHQVYFWAFRKYLSCRIIIWMLTQTLFASLKLLNTIILIWHESSNMLPQDKYSILFYVLWKLRQAPNMKCNETLILSRYCVTFLSIQYIYPHTILCSLI